MIFYIQQFHNLICNSNHLNVKKISFFVMPDVNDLRCFDVDIVLVYSKQIHETLLTKTAQEYFQLKVGLIRENPRGLRIISVEILPEKTYITKEVNIDPNMQLIDCMIFCHFTNPNNRVVSKLASLGNNSKIKVHIDQSGISLMAEESEINK